MTIEFDGRVAIVTGAGRGLGRAYALELARRGAAVVVNDTGGDLAGTGGDAAVAEKVVGEIEADGGTALASAHDIADEVAAADLVAAAARRFGSVDILVNNAGNLFHDKIVEMPPADFDATISVHLRGSFNMCRAAAPHMARAGWGRIVLTTSQVGFFGKIESGAYGAAKMGVAGLMATLALELAPHGVLVNAISPLAFTRMAAESFPPELEPFLEPQQVAAGVAFLCSDAFRETGTILIAGGGHFSVARMVESPGIDIEDPKQITAEAVAARYAEISDLAAPQVFADAMAAVGETFQKVRRRAGLES